MLDRLRGNYNGASVAVLGSAPSLRLFNRSNAKEDLIIGVNGAGEVLVPGDLFFSMDEMANTRSWYKELSPEIMCVLRPHAAIFSSRFYPDEKIRHKFIAGYKRLIELHPEIGLEKCGYMIALPSELSPAAKVIDDLFSEESLPEPQKPHLIIRKFIHTEPISRDQRILNYGGTSACAALQLAHIMGARKINLYGVEFSNDVPYGQDAYSGGNYFYKPKPGETGRTTEDQKIFMDYVIEKIMKQGTEVISHGPTRLEKSIKTS